MKQDLSKLAVSEYYALDKSTGNYIPIASKLALHYEIQNKELLKKRKNPQFEIVKRTELVALFVSEPIQEPKQEPIKKPRGFQKKKV